MRIEHFHCFKNRGLCTGHGFLIFPRDIVAESWPAVSGRLASRSARRRRIAKGVRKKILEIRPGNPKNVEKTT
ncbi:MAG: hypothetical protein RIC18_03160 [Hoeflea sp.]|uniref:hypothetical protein n=1 Tax=Hoeflea sp. TaxID=1940281 RepID=UPI0032EDA1E4